MIDLKYTQKQFNEFIKRYDLENEMMKLKIAHMLRVMDLNYKLAQLQGLDAENLELAGVIGLLHDVGRFVQIEKYGTFIDAKSVNHCVAGVDLLFKEEYIEYFVEDSKYYYIIEKTIANHGRYEIEEGLDENTLIHCKLIRDSDKIDIFEVLLRDNLTVACNVDYISNAIINDKIKSQFYSHKLINNADVHNVYDFFIKAVAYIYDFNFKEDLKFVKEKDYFNRFFKRFIEWFNIDNEEIINELKEIILYANEYIDSLLKK